MQTDIIIGVTIGIIGIIIGIFGSYYFYRKSLREKAPCWVIRSNNLIKGFSSRFQNLQVLFKGKQVENLTISKVMFWNDGAETIKNDDIETVNRIRISTTKEVSLLDAKILATNNHSSQFEVNLDEENNCVYLEFDYLDKKQGAVVQVIHTGSSSQDLEVIGDIKGVKVITQKGLTPKWVKLTKRFKISSKLGRNATIFTGMVLGVVYVVYGTLNSLFPSVVSFFSTKTGRFDEWFFSVIMISLGILLLVMSFGLLRQTNIAPKGLEIIEKD